MKFQVGDFLVLQNNSVALILRIEEELSSKFFRNHRRKRILHVWHNAIFFKDKKGHFASVPEVILEPDVIEIFRARMAER